MYVLYIDVFVAINLFEFWILIHSVQICLCGNTCGSRYFSSCILLNENVGSVHQQWTRIYMTKWIRKPVNALPRSILHVMYSSCDVMPWCIPWSLAIGFLWSRWRRKRSWHSWRMRNPWLCVSGKSPIGKIDWYQITTNTTSTKQMHI